MEADTRVWNPGGASMTISMRGEIGKHSTGLIGCWNSSLGIEINLGIGSPGRTRGVGNWLKCGGSRKVSDSWD